MFIENIPTLKRIGLSVWSLAQANQPKEKIYATYKPKNIYSFQNVIL